MTINWVEFRSSGRGFVHTHNKLYMASRIDQYDPAVASELCI